jgi:hypothetical protein
VKQEAIALVRFLPAGAADLGPEVTRDELREAGIGGWSGKVTHRDDVSCVFGPAERPPELPPEFEYVVPTTDEAPKATERVVRMRFGTDG